MMPSALSGPSSSSSAFVIVKRRPKNDMKLFCQLKIINLQKKTHLRPRQCHLHHLGQHRICHGLCLVMFFPKNNHRMAPTESLMMAASPLFSATIITGHLHRTYIGAPSEYFLHSATTNKPAFLSLSLPTSTMCFLPQHNQSPTMLHTCSMFQANVMVCARSRSFRRTIKGRL